jgi:hypothetical protein
MRLRACLAFSQAAATEAVCFALAMIFFTRRSATFSRSAIAVSTVPRSCNASTCSVRPASDLRCLAGSFVESKRDAFRSCSSVGLWNREPGGAACNVPSSLVRIGQAKTASGFTTLSLPLPGFPTKTLPCQTGRIRQSSRALAFGATALTVISSLSTAWAVGENRSGNSELLRGG